MIETLLALAFGMVVGFCVGVLIARPPGPPSGGYQPRPSNGGPYSPPYRNPPPRQP